MNLMLDNHTLMLVLLASLVTTHRQSVVLVCVLQIQSLAFLDTRTRTELIENVIDFSDRF